MPILVSMDVGRLLGTAFVLLLPALATAQDGTGDDGSAPREPTAIEKERMEKEKPRKTSFFDRVHLDLLGAPPDTRASGPIGIVGAHLTIVEHGRLNFYGPPGVMLLLHPSESGGWTGTTAFSWGLSVRLTEFEMRGSARKAVMFLNLTKVWTWGGLGHGTDFIGLSFAWKTRTDDKPPAKP